VLTELLADSGTALFAIDAHNVERAREIAARMATPPVLAAFGAEGADIVDLSSARDIAPFSLSSAVSGEIATVIFTSGSTGVPKGVERSFLTLFFLVLQANATYPKGVSLITAPVVQSSAIHADMAMSCGSTIVLHDGFDAARVLEAICKHRVTRLYLTPPQLYQLVDHPARATTDLSSLNAIMYTGCTASPSRLAQAVEAFGPILLQVYGASEALSVSMLLPPDHLDPKRLSSVGRPPGVVEVSIRDPHTAEALPLGQTGEVCVRSPVVMRGYWQNPALTAQTLRNDWLHTGDVGYMDDEGYLYLVDRLASMIKRAGLKLYPATIENVLLSHPSVAQAAVYGVADADNLEHVHASVVLRPGHEIDSAELREHVARSLSPAHAPAAIAVLAELPSLDSGKPDKRRLRFDAEIAAGLSRGDSRRL
jgi:fatty-acyl-CoA synthase